MDTALPTPVFARRNVAYACATLCCLLWGSSYPAIKSGYELFQIATDDIPSKVVFAGYRFLFAGALLLLFALAQRKPIGRLTPTQFGQLTILGLTQTSLQYTFFYIGLAYTTGVNGSIMNATGTFFSVLLAHFIYHNDKLRYNKTLGCVVGFAGVMLVNFH
ncbi:DMT family transporter, partial [Enterobacter hormaechei subsp. steigerwaltii]